MPLMTIGKCFRGRDDCQSFHVIEGGIPDDVTEAQLDTLDFVPASFVCCGCIAPEKRDPPQDAFRLCFKNQYGADDMSDNDEQDLVHLIAVVSTALAVTATRRANHGYIHVPHTFDGEDVIAVNTKQGVDDPLVLLQRGDARLSNLLKSEDHK